MFWAVKVLVLFVKANLYLVLKTKCILITTRLKTHMDWTILRRFKFKLRKFSISTRISLIGIILSRVYCCIELFNAYHME